MPVLTFIYKNGLWLSWPLLILGVILLWLSIMNAVKLGDDNRICSLPLEAGQSVEFPEAGEVVLWLEGPQLTTRFAGLTFELTGSDGSICKGRGTLVRQRSSGLAKVRITDRVFSIPHPGRYTLHTNGLGAAKAGDEKHQLIFMRPHAPQTIVWVLGIILGAVLAIGGIVNFFLRLSQGGGS